MDKDKEGLIREWQAAMGLKYPALESEARADSYFAALRNAEVWAELGIRPTNVRRKGNTVRVTVRYTDGRTSEQTWTDGHLVKAEFG